MANDKINDKIMDQNYNSNDNILVNIKEEENSKVIILY